MLKAIRSDGEGHMIEVIKTGDMVIEKVIIHEWVQLRPDDSNVLTCDICSIISSSEHIKEKEAHRDKRRAEYLQECKAKTDLLLLQQQEQLRLKKEADDAQAAAKSAAHAQRNLEAEDRMRVVGEMVREFRTTPVSHYDQHAARAAKERKTDEARKRDRRLKNITTFEE
jgi:hypothetical protein